MTETYRALSTPGCLHLTSRQEGTRHSNRSHGANQPSNISTHAAVFSVEVAPPRRLTQFPVNYWDKRSGVACDFHYSRMPWHYWSRWGLGRWPAGGADATLMDASETSEEGTGERVMHAEGGLAYHFLERWRSRICIFIEIFDGNEWRRISKYQPH